MTLDSSEIFVGNSGNVYIAPLDTPLPDQDDDVLDAAFVDLGYFNEDGVAMTNGRTINEVRAWQSYSPLRRLVASMITGFTFSMLQMNSQNLAVAFGGGTVEEVTTGHFDYTAPTPAEGITQWALVLDVIDEAGKLRFTTAKVELEGDVTMAFSRNEAVVLPVTLTVLDPGTSAMFHILSDLPQFSVYPAAS